MLNFIKDVINNQPTDWLKLTTHRLDIYNESMAKTEFIYEFERLAESDNSDTKALANLPTAYDYIRLGHPLSSVLEWAVAKSYGVQARNVIAFGSKTMPLMAILRKNSLLNRKTRVLYVNDLPTAFDMQTVRDIYEYDFELVRFDSVKDIAEFDGSTVFVSETHDIHNFEKKAKVDFYINMHPQWGSVVLIDSDNEEAYIVEIQHVRRRESIAMTPADCDLALRQFVNVSTASQANTNYSEKYTEVAEIIRNVSGTNSKALIASSGLSVQYAILMGLVDVARQRHPNKDIKFIVPPNCYGGTNDQTRRVAAALDNFEVLDLPVDSGNDMAEGIERILTEVAELDAVPYILAEIPTNPRVEVPNLESLKTALSKLRQTSSGQTAVAPVFILDQTFCPNVQLFANESGANNKGILADVATISFASASKFASGGKCTAGYCFGSNNTEELLESIEKHLKLCDNEAKTLQLETLAKQMPSMIKRVTAAYKNTRDFVNYIEEVLPAAKINFVSEELASQGFTPSVFSLDLPTKGNTEEEKETYKRALNHKLIKLMITEIPNESKYCVSYGQSKGCYWTIPATSTQGTTKESDKDYIVRVSVSPNLDLERHKAVFNQFVQSI